MISCLSSISGCLLFCFAKGEDDAPFVILRGLAGGDMRTAADALTGGTRCGDAAGLEGNSFGSILKVMRPLERSSNNVMIFPWSPTR